MKATLGRPGLVDLHLLALASLAVAQPVLDLLGRNAEMLVAHGAGRGEILALVGVLCFVAPLPLLALVRLARAASPRLGDAATLAAVGTLAGLVALAALARFEMAPPGVVLAVAAAAGVVAASAYARLAPIRSFVTLLSPAILVVPLAFLLGTPVRGLLAGAPRQLPTARVDAEAPILLLVFDELSLVSLLDADGRIDGERFPGFAELAAGSTWFRNTASVADITEWAVPAILTGRHPRPGQLPTLADHPRNLFTLFAADYDVVAQEPITELLPPEEQGTKRGEPAVRRFAQLGSDLAVVWAHRVLPRRLTDRLPRIDQGWRDFAGGSAPALPPAPAGGAATRDADHFFTAALRGLAADRRAELQTFLAAVGPGADDKTLHVAHVLLPHGPWHYLPSGRSYPAPPDLPGLVDERWAHDPWLLRQGEQRYLLQLAAVDGMLRDLWHRLRELELYDRMLIAVVADHGLAFVGGESRRHVERENLPEILMVPFFLKAPGQTSGVVVDRPASTVDVLPTLLDALDVVPPWPFDGFSRLDETSPAPPPQIWTKSHGVVRYDPDVRRRGLTAPSRETLFGIARGGDLYAVGPAPELIDRRLDELPGAALPGLAVEIDGEQLYEAVDPAAAWTPALVTGRLLRAVDSRSNYELAVAVDGVVRTTTRTWRDSAGGLRFAALLVEDDLRPGANRIEVAAIRGRGANLMLERTEASAAATSIAAIAVERGRGGKLVALRSGGTTIPVVPDSVDGWIERTALERGSVVVSGWAAQLATGGLPRRLHVFAGDRLVHSGTTSIARLSVTKQRNDPRVLTSGFRFAIPAARVANLETEGLRVLAVTDDGKQAGELSVFVRLDRAADRPAALLLSDGRRVPLRPERPRGYVELRRTTAEGLHLAGWAADPEATGEPLEILVFSGPRLVRRQPPQHVRPDVAAALRRPELGPVGFDVFLPTKLFSSAGEVTVVATSSRRFATELVDVSTAVGR